jgi:hypothetical protein
MLARKYILTTGGTATIANAVLAWGEDKRALFEPPRDESEE